MWKPEHVKRLDMKLADGRLTGAVDLEGWVKGPARNDHSRYSVHLLGFVEVKDGKLTRFDVVAVGPACRVAGSGPGIETHGEIGVPYTLAIGFRLSTDQDSEHSAHAARSRASRRQGGVCGICGVTLHFARAGGCPNADRPRLRKGIFSEHDMDGKLKMAAAGLLKVLAASVCGAAEKGQPGPTLKPEQFAALHTLIKPQPGELRFHEIPWLIDVWEARKKAAAEGKPILVWSGAGGCAPRGLLKCRFREAVRLPTGPSRSFAWSSRSLSPWPSTAERGISTTPNAGSWKRPTAEARAGSTSSRPAASWWPAASCRWAIPRRTCVSLERALKAWAALPESERKPGAIQVPERGPLDPRRNAAKGPPPGTLIVRVYNRQLERTPKGEYRHTVPEDYIPALRDPKVVGTDQATALWTQPANDYLWITQAEAQAMMPADPKPGQRVEVPTSLCERIFRFHLDPSRGLSENNNFAHVTAAAGKLHLTVEAVSDARGPPSPRRFCQPPQSADRAQDLPVARHQGAFAKPADSAGLRPPTARLPRLPSGEEGLHPPGHRGAGRRARPAQWREHRGANGWARPTRWGSPSSWSPTPDPPTIFRPRARDEVSCAPRSISWSATWGCRRRSGPIVCA